MKEKIMRENPPGLSLIAARAENGVIGRKGELPWHISSDLKRFRKLTLGKSVIMGRKTWQAIFRRNGSPLDRRRNIVMTRNGLDLPPGVRIARSAGQAVQLCGGEGEAMIIGGAEIYAAFLPRARRIYLTQIAASPEGDAFFPKLNPAEWRETRSETPPQTPKDSAPFQFLTLERS